MAHGQDRTIVILLWGKEIDRKDVLDRGETGFVAGEVAVDRKKL